MGGLAASRLDRLGVSAPRGQSSGREQSHCPPGLRQPQLCAGAPTRGDVQRALLAPQRLPRGAGQAESDPEAGLHPGGTLTPQTRSHKGRKGTGKEFSAASCSCYVYEFDCLQREHFTSLSCARA